MNGDLLLIEVLPVQSIMNGTAVTAVTVDYLRKGHRRQKRDVDIKETITFQKTDKKQNTFKVRKRTMLEFEQPFDVVIMYLKKKKNKQTNKK